MVQNRIRNSGVQTWYKMNLRAVDVDEAPLLKKIPFHARWSGTSVSY